VIDVGMADEDMLKALHLARGERGDVTEIEQNGAALE